MPSRTKQQPSSSSSSSSRQDLDDKFQAYYLQRVTKEFSDDLDRIRTADDFRPDSIPFLVHALQQGATAAAGMYSPAQKARIVGVSLEEKKKKDTEEDEDVDMDGDFDGTVSSSSPAAAERVESDSETSSSSGESSGESSA